MARSGVFNPGCTLGSEGKLLKMLIPVTKIGIAQMIITALLTMVKKKKKMLIYRCYPQKLPSR